MFYEENDEKTEEKAEIMQKTKPFSYKNKKAGDSYKISLDNEYVIQEKHKTIGFFVKTMREAYGMTIQAVITRCGIPKSTYQMLEAGDMRVKFPYVERVLQLFGYSLMPVLDFNNTELMENIKELPNRADYLLAVEMSKKAMKNPMLKKFTDKELKFQKFLLRFQKKRDVALQKTSEGRARVAKIYRKKLAILRKTNKFILSFMPKKADREACGLIMRRYNGARKRRNRLVKRPKNGQ